MAGPWERYRDTSAETGPWTKYAAPAETPDPYRQAAIEERDALKAKGIDTGAGYTRRLAQGASFGLADEVIAGLSTPLEMIKHRTFDPREGYGYAKARENLILEDARDKTGLLGAVAEGVGGVATGGLLAKGGVLPTANLAPGARLAKRVGVGMAEGAGIGGLYGAAEGEGAEGRLAEGAKGATTGGIVGGALPLLSNVASIGYRAFQNFRSGQDVAKKLGISPEVMRIISGSLEADGTIGSRGAANLARAGQEAMIADAGPNAKALLDTAVARSGPGAVRATDAISERVGRDAKALTSALDKSLGKPQGVTAAQTTIRKGTSTARGEAYRAAYDHPINYAAPEGQALEGLIRSRVPASAIKAANDLMRVEGNSSKQILARMADDGSVTFEQLPDVRQLDYITRGLNEVADKANGQGKLGGTTPLGRAYEGLSREIRDSLRSQVPAYDAALKTAADPIKRIQAVDLGSKLLSPSVTRDAAAEALKGMTEAERRAVAQGLRSNIDDAMARVSRTVMDGDTEAREAIKALKDLSSRANREKVSLAIGEEKANSLFREVDRVATSFDLRASVAQNSKTYAREAMDRRVKQMAQPGPIGKVAQGEPINAGKRLVQLLTGKTPEKIAAHEDRIYADVAGLLTAPRQYAVPIFQGIDKLKNLDIQNAAKANALLRNLTRNQAVAYPLAMQSLEGLRKRPLPW